MLRLPVLSVPVICDPLAGQPLSYAVDNHPHPAQLDLTDTPREVGQLSIDVLIGVTTIGGW